MQISIGTILESPLLSLPTLAKLGTTCEAPQALANNVPMPIAHPQAFTKHSLSASAQAAARAGGH